MTPELAVSLAKLETAGQPLHVQMRTANKIFEANSTDWRKPFAPVDVAFAVFVDYLKDNCTQRERDLVVVSNQFSPVWTTLHITMQVMKESPSPSDEREIANVVQALCRLELGHLLRDGLRSDICKWLDELEKDAH